MPARTEKQRKFMGAELARKRAGEQTRTNMSEEELRKMASKHKSPPSDVQGFTTTTDLPQRADHGTSPVPADRSETGASVSGGPPADVKTYGVFHKYPYQGEKKIKESADKGPSVAAEPPADVQKFQALPKKGG